MKEKHYDVIAIGAHPDDVEFGCGGALIDLHLKGYRIGIVILTEGEMGTGGTREIRAQETIDAANLLGADILRVFDWGDTRLEDQYEKRLELAAIIRKAKPKIVLTHYPHVAIGRKQSHPDHVATGTLTLNAINHAALKKIDIPGTPHYVSKIFHFTLPPGVMPTFVIDITPHFDHWMKALSAHRSQFLNKEKTKDYIELLTAMARGYGLMAGCKYGQAFYSSEPILMSNLMYLMD